MFPCYGEGREVLVVVWEENLEGWGFTKIVPCKDGQRTGLVGEVLFCCGG